MYEEVEDFVRSMYLWENGLARGPVNPDYGDALSKRLIKALITSRATALHCLNETAALQDADAIRHIQHREGNDACYGQERPYRPEKHYPDCCAERSCLWRTYCEIHRNGYRKVFVSYAHEDLNLARALCTRLQEAGVRVWFDEWDIESGVKEGVWELLEEGLATSNAILSLCTSQYRQRHPPPPPEWRGRDMSAARVAHNPAPFLSFEEVRWVGTWHAGALFKVIHADFELEGLKANYRAPLFPKRARGGTGAPAPDGRVYDGSSTGGFFPVIPVTLGEDPWIKSEPVIGEVIRIPFRDHNRGMALLLRELST